jgi:hypothetical protein
MNCLERKRSSEPSNQLKTIGETGCLFLLTTSTDGGLTLTTDLLLLVLEFLTELTREVLLVGLEASASKTILGFSVESIFERVIDEGKAGRLLTTESSAETEDEDSLVILDLELLSNDFLEFLLGDVSLTRMKDIEDLIKS